MPIRMWNRLDYMQDDSSEELNAAKAPTTTESEQTVSDLNIDGEMLDASSRIEKENSSDHDSSTETIVSSSTDDCCDEADNESAEFRSFAADDSKFSRKQTSNESQDFQINRRFRPSTHEDRPKSTVQDFEAGFNMKLFLFDLISLISALLVSTLAIGFGAGHIGNCPADLSMPYHVLIMGVLGLFIISYVLLTTNRENFKGLKENERTLISLSSWLLMGLWAWEVVKFASMDVSFDSKAENYCNHAFYTFIILMNIVFSVLGFFIGLGLLGLDANRKPCAPTLSNRIWWRF